MYFSASKGVSVVAEFDKVRGQFPEKVLLTTENHNIFMVAELVRPASSPAERLHELATCLETVVIYFSTSKGVSMAVEFGKVRSQFLKNAADQRKSPPIHGGDRARMACQLSPATITRACHIPGDGRAKLHLE